MTLAAGVVAFLGLAALLVALLAHLVGYGSPANSVEVPRGPFVGILVALGIGLLALAAWLTWGVR